MIPTLAEALAERGYESLTDVQQAVTAPELAEADLLVSAQTGSGKTVGFGLAIAGTLLGENTRFGPAGAPLALVVAPTRELALQVQRELGWLYAKAGARVASCIGGMDARDERRALERGAHVVVGTPGRLCDHIKRGSLDLGAIRAIVLDEADEMLDLGFREDLEYMLGEAPEDRRTLLFSATVPPAIAELAKTFQRDAERVTTLTRGVQHTDIAYHVVQVSAQDAEHAIINLLRFHDAPTAIVFANTRAMVARLVARLSNRGLAAVSLSGELSQSERTHALQAMRDGRARVCVATDVAARGIDLPNLDLVIHADLPTNTETLLHRSGRTGRAGRKGISALIATDKAMGKAKRLLKWAKIDAEWTFAPTPDEILALDEQRLIDDEIWQNDLSEGEAAFAARLLAEHGPERIAAACLRLYRAKLSAPEELNAAPEPGKRAERAPFGPSVWFELSVGRDRNAEARWLLPLVCRAGNLEKSHIGKIRIEANRSFVEIAEAAAGPLAAMLEQTDILEDDVSARKVDGVPSEPARGPRPDRPRPHRKGPRGDRDTPASDAPKGAGADMPAAAENPVRAKPVSKDRPARPRHADAKDTRGDQKPWSKPKGDRPSGDKKPWSKPKGDAPSGDKKPWGKPKGDAAKGDKKPWSKPKGDAPKSDRKPWDKPKGDRKSSDKARADRPTGDRKPWDKPKGKPAAKPKSAPAGVRPGASDTSKRMDRPGAPKRPGKPNFARGGNTPPRRKP